jgi:hypothetical protein
MAGQSTRQLNTLHKTIQRRGLLNFTFYRKQKYIVNIENAKIALNLCGSQKKHMDEKKSLRQIGCGLPTNNLSCYNVKLIKTTAKKTSTMNTTKYKSRVMTVAKQYSIRNFHVFEDSNRDAACHNAGEKNLRRFYRRARAKSDLYHDR